MFKTIAATLFVLALIVSFLLIAAFYLLNAPAEEDK